MRVHIHGLVALAILLFLVLGFLATAYVAVKLVLWMLPLFVVAAVVLLLLFLFNKKRKHHDHIDVDFRVR